MLGEHTLNPAVIDGRAVAVPDHSRQFTRGKGMGQGQSSDVLLEMLGQEHGRPGLAPRMR